MEEGAQRPDVVYHLHHLTKWDDSCQSQMQAANDTSSSNTVHTLLLSRVSSPCEGLTLSAHCISNHMCWENHRQRQTNFPNIRKSLWVYICRLSPHRFFFLDAFNVVISVTGLSNSLPLASSEPKTFGTLNEPFNFMSYPTCALSVWYPAAFIVIIGAAGLKSATMFGKRLRSESQTPLGKSPSHSDTFLHLLQNCIF